MLRNLYEQVLGHPIIYNYVRPFCLGGVDYSKAYSLLLQNSDDVLIDFGCGFGDALRYIRNFKEYHGFDIDPRAIDHLRQEYRVELHPNIHTYARTLTADDVRKIKPNKVIIAGALHHLSNDEVKELLQMLSAGNSVQMILTIDVVYLKMRPINNLLASLDRGKFVRTESGYVDLFKGTGFEVALQEIDYSNRWACYFITRVVPTKSA